MSDATTAADIALDVLVKEALRDVDLEQAALQTSVDAPLDKLAETMIDADDLETEPATNPVEPAAQVVATAVVATPASQYSVVAGVAVASPTKRQKTQVPNGWVSKQVAHLWQLKIVRRAFRPTHARTADATCQCSQTALHEEVAWYKALAKAHDLPMYPHSQ